MYCIQYNSTLFIEVCTRRATQRGQQNIERVFEKIRKKRKKIHTFKLRRSMEGEETKRKVQVRNNK